MRNIALIVLLLGAVWTQTSAVCTGRVDTNAFAGDLTTYDGVFSAAGSGYVSMPAMQIGGSTLNFDIDVFATTVSPGCLFSYVGTGSTPAQIAASGMDLVINEGKIIFTAGGQTTETFVIYNNPADTTQPQRLNTWNRVTVAISQQTGTVTIYLNGQQVAQRTGAAIMPIALRKGYIGLCPAQPQAVKGLKGKVDNFIVSTEPKTAFDISFQQSQFFPIVPENGLIAYYDFNKASGASVPAWTGAASIPSNLDGTLQGTGGVFQTRSSSADKTCSFAGGHAVSAANGDVVSPYYGVIGGGYTGSFQCKNSEGQDLSFLQKWDAATGLAEVSIFASLDHRFRVSIGASGLQVLHQNWGGWERIGITTEFIEDDLMTLQVEQNAFKVQVGGKGWIHIRNNEGVLAYDFAVNTAGCGQGADLSHICSWDADYDLNKYNFALTPLPEPMGPDAVGAGGIGGFPDVLACPSPGDPCPGWYCDGTSIYRPDKVCPTSPNDVRCCSYSAAYATRVVCRDMYPEGYCAAHPEDAWCCDRYPSNAVCLDARPELYCKTSVGRANPLCCTKGYDFGCQAMCKDRYPSIYCSCSHVRDTLNQAPAIAQQEASCCAYNKGAQYCASVQPPSPPPPPVSPVIDPPFVPGDACENLIALNKPAYDAVNQACAYIWGAADSREKRQCIAQGCTTGTDQVPAVDCVTAKLFKLSDPTYPVPEVCGSCPNDCSLRGSCNAGTCACGEGWTGDDCSTPSTYPCFTATDVGSLPISIAPLPEIYRNPAGGSSRVVQQTVAFSDYSLKNFNYKYAPRVSDSLLITPVYTMDWATKTKQHHLWFTLGDAREGAGSTGDVVITIPAAFGKALAASGDNTFNRYSIFVDGSSASGSCTGATDLTCTLKASVGGQVSLFLRAVEASATLQISSAVPVLLASANRQREQIAEVYRAVPTSGNSYSIVYNVATCAAPTACKVSTCDACVAQTECGWCIETNSCMPGNAAGPAVSQCMNWRYTFDDNVTRRLTQIAGFPSNPAVTDVFTSTTSNLQLPVDLSVVIQPHNQVPWDVVLLSEFHEVNRPSWKTAMDGIRTDLLSGYPNSAIGFGALVPAATAPLAYRMLSPMTNPNSNYNFGSVINLCNTNCATAAAPVSVDVKKALFNFAEEANNDFQLRLGFATRRIVTVFTSATPSVGDSTDVAQLRLRLLAKNVIPVFIYTVGPSAAQNANLKAAYEGIVSQLGFGFTATIDSAWTAKTVQGAVIDAMKKASYQVSLTHTAAQDASVLDVAAFNARKSSFVVNNLRPDTFIGLEYRARMVLPVRNQNVGAVAAAQLFVPGFSAAVIEDVPTDKPTFKGAVSVYNVDEGSSEGVVIHLPGESFRNLYQVAPTITSAVHKVGADLGSFHELADLESFNGVSPYYGAGDVITTISGYTPVSKAIVYKPPTVVTSEAGKTYGQGFVTITYKLTDACVESASTFTITINVDHVNHAPFANAIPAHGDENTPIIVNLDGSDRDGDELEYYISNGVRDSSEAQSANAGVLYQYYDNFDAKNPDTSKVIGAGDVKVTSGTRIIYMPPRFKHSFAAADSGKLLIPCLTYYVQEKASEQLKSVPVDVPITINHVNNKPWVWNDADRTDGAGTWEFPTVFADGAQSEVCWAGYNAPVCTWEEDFGEEYWWKTGFRYIHLGGFDIDGGRLAFIISNIDCFPGAMAQVHLAGSETIAVGTTMVNQENGKLTSALRFRPAKETHTALNAGKSYYCKIEYRVRDDQAAISQNVGAVTIDITDVNKQPRLESYENTFTGYEEQPTEFNLDVNDPELDPFTTTLVSCQQPRGIFEFCTTEDCTAIAATIDCANIKPEGIVIPRPADGKMARGLFTSGRLESPSDGIAYNVLTFLFDDSVSKFAPRPFEVTFNVIRLNTAPVIAVNGVVADQHTLSVDFAATTFAAQFDVDDKDIAQGYITVTVALDSSKASGAVLDTSYAAQFATLVIKNDGAVFTFEAELAEAKKAIAVISVVSPVFDAEKFPEGTATAVLRVTANDQGNSGQCPTDTFLRLSNCPLETTTVVIISWVHASDNTAAVIGGSAAAAGFGVAAIAAAAVIFKRMQQSASTNDYIPWDQNEESEEVAVNPLYEGTGNSGTNALYEFNPVANQPL